MTEHFSYSTEPKTQQIQFPIWPDHDRNSEASQNLIRNKQINDDNYWSNMINFLKHDFNTLPKEFLKLWTSVMTVPLMSNTKHSDYIRLSLEDASRDPRVDAAITEPMVGIDQERFDHFYRVFADNNYSMNRMQHYGHLRNCDFTSEKLSKMDTIVELGGGLGEMADIVYKLGFKGEYYVYDFKELGNIQKYIHDELGLNKVHHISDIEDLPKDSDLVIATWSLTEMPYDLREQILSKLKADQNWLVAYSKSIFGYDNEKWITNQFKKYNTTFKDIPSMPWDGGSKYMVINKNGR